MASTLPTFSRGLKLVRLGVIALLLQLAASVVFGFKSAFADGPDEVLEAMEYVRYLHLANVLAVAVMAVGVVSSIPELSRARVSLFTMIASAIGLVVATLVLLWTYDVITEYCDLLSKAVAALKDPARFEELEAMGARFEGAAARLKTLSSVVVFKDLAYGGGLYFLIRTVQVSAAHNDQLALRDRAGHMHRALLVMIAGDLFYQVTYAKSHAGGWGVLLIAIYWIYCHVKLQRFLFDSAWFVNEPHNLPGATVVKLPEEKPPAPRVSRPSMPKVTPEVAPPVSSAEAPAPRPSQPAPMIVVAQPTAPTPRAASVSEGEAPGDGPRFLR